MDKQKYQIKCFQCRHISKCLGLWWKGGSHNGYIRTTKCFIFQGQLFSVIWIDFDQWTIHIIDTRGGYYSMLVQTTYGTKNHRQEKGRLIRKRWGSSKGQFIIKVVNRVTQKGQMHSGLQRNRFLCAVQCWGMHFSLCVNCIYIFITNMQQQ